MLATARPSARQAQAPARADSSGRAVPRPMQQRDGCEQDERDRRPGNRLSFDQGRTTDQILT
jgi:hypothetical protein